MKNNRVFRQFCAWLILLLVLVGLSVPAYAVSGEEIDTGRTGSIRISCFYDLKPVSGGNLLLYRVATLEYEDGQYYFRLSPELGGEKLTQSELDRKSLAGELAAHAGLKELGSTEKTFGEDGVVRFDDLAVGLYLLVQTRAAAGFECMGPVLVSVPFQDPKTGELTYDVDATAKPELEREASPTSPTPTPTPTPTTPPDDPPGEVEIPDDPTPLAPTPTKSGPGLPQTGQLNWPVPVLVGAGALFLLLGLWLLVSDARRTRE